MPNLSTKLAAAQVEHELPNVPVFLMRSRGYTLEQVNEMITERRT